jgi:multiple sugar transport system substrate-binding protein
MSMSRLSLSSWRSRVGTLLGGAICVVALGACAGVGSGGSGGAAATTGSGGGFGGTPSGALNIMGFSGEDEVATSRIAAFQASAPGVQVTHNKGDFDAQQFLTALASGNAPDLVYMDRALIGTYAAQGALQPMTACVQDQGIDTSQYRPAALKSVTMGGVVYGIPEFETVTVNMIDTTSLKSAGATSADIQTADWPALEQTAKKLFAADGAKIGRIGFDTKIPDSFVLWAQINGAQIVKDDGSPNINDPKAVEALDYNLKLVGDQGGWNSYKAFRDSMDIFGDNNPLTAHKLGAMPMDSWYVNVLSGFLGKGLTLDSTMVTDRSGKPVSTLGGSAWAIPKGAKNGVAACAWAKTMTATDTWMQAAKARAATVEKKSSVFTGIYTANTAADAQIKATYVKPGKDAGVDKAIENVYAALDVAQPVNPSPAGAEINAAWKSAVSRALSGQQSAQQALDQAQKEAQTAFDKAKK